MQEVTGPLERRLIRDRRPALLAAPRSFEPLLAHEPRHVVATDLDSFALELLPGLAYSVDAPVARTGSMDLPDQLAVLNLAP